MEPIPTNRNRIYNLIRTDKDISRQNIALNLNLSLPTVVQNLTELLEEGYVRESGSIGNTGGRRAKAYAVTEQYRVAIGLDITRNHISVVVVDMEETIIYHDRTRHIYEDTPDYYKHVGQIVKQVVKELQLCDTQVCGVGIALPALITEDHEKVYYGKILNNYKMKIEDFEKYISYPCRLYNDANAAGVAEFRLNPDISEMFYISLSNNVGGAVVIDSKIYQGDCSRSGEFGHMTIVPDGRECYCGKKGCLESYCSASLLAQHTDGNLAEFFQQVEAGDEICKKEWEEYLKYLAIGVNNIRMLFDCTVIIGGYIGAYMDEYLEQLKEMVCDRTPFEENADYLHACKCKTEAIAAGAALPFIDDVIRNI